MSLKEGWKYEQMPSTDQQKRLSFLASLMPLVMRLRGSKKVFASEAATLARRAQQQLRPESFSPPKSLDKVAVVTVSTENGWPVYTLTPHGSLSPKRAIFSHGGSWINEISPFHWRFLADLMKATGAQFIVPIYPLAPAGTAASVIPAIADLAAQAVAEVGAANVMLIGDSAGGTISLSVAMVLRDRGVPAPANIVLIAPALDLTFTDPRIAEIEPHDPWLATPGNRAAARLWSGSLPVSDPLVSPLNGELAGLGAITLFSGTRDIIHPDSLSLVTKAQGVGHALDYHERAGLLHNYPILPIPEAKQARDTIKTLLEH